MEALSSMRRDSKVLLAVLWAKNRLGALTLLAVPSEVAVDDRILWAAIEMDDAEVLERVCELPIVNLNVQIEGLDPLAFAEKRGYMESALVLLRLRLAKSARIVLVGAGASGKTRLRKVMQGRKYVERATDLLEIDWDWTMDGVRLHVWDFAGQVGYYAAQQFRLGDGAGAGSLFFVLAMVDVRKSASQVQSELDEWLGTCAATARKR